MGLQLVLAFILVCWRPSSSQCRSGPGWGSSFLRRSSAHLLDWTLWDALLFPGVPSQWTSPVKLRLEVWPCNNGITTHPWVPIRSQTWGPFGEFGWGSDALQIALVPPWAPSWKRAQLLGSDSRPAAPPVEKPAFNLDVLFLSPWKSLCGTN